MFKDFLASLAAGIAAIGTWFTGAGATLDAAAAYITELKAGEAGIDTSAVTQALSDLGTARDALDVKLAALQALLPAPAAPVAGDGTVTQ